MNILRRLKALRIWVLVNLLLMALLLIFGMAFEMGGPAAGSSGGITLGRVITDLHQAGIASYIHIILGLLVGLFSLINMILVLRSRLLKVQICGTLAFLFILAAGILGLFFIASGFQNTGLLVGLVPLFGLSVLSYLLELVFLRTPVISQPG